MSYFPYFPLFPPFLLSPTNPIHTQVANELAKAKIPIILTANRGAPDTFEKRNSLPGPPLSKSPAAVLAEAGVLFGLAIPGESLSNSPFSKPKLIQEQVIPIFTIWPLKQAGQRSMLVSLQGKL
jgi:hypothetical protein